MRAIQRTDEGDRSERRRRVSTLVFFGLIAAATAILLARGGNDPAADPGAADPSTPAVPGTTSLPGGTYRLPGLSAPVSVTLPEGWFAGDSIWGATGRGVAAVSTGRPGATISVAVLDLERLRPIDAATGRPTRRPAVAAWFRRSLDDYAVRVQPRVRDHVVGRQHAWRAPAPLAWLLTVTDRGPIDVADDVVYDATPGHLASFAFPGPERPLFAVDGGGRITLRPGVTYTFWLPRPRGGEPPGIMLGVARELGVAPGAREWEVVRTIELGP
jgi:hypothetical protein